jgi:hypothetical protein
MPITTNEVASTGVPTKTDEVASPGMPAITDEKQGQSSSTQPWYFRKELGPRVSSKFSTKARGKLVADIRGELKRYKKQLDSLPKDYEKLAKRYPKCIVFDIYLRHPEKRSDFDECILYTQPAELSYIMASAVAGVGRDAIKAAWDNCR